MSSNNNKKSKQSKQPEKPKEAPKNPANDPTLPLDPAALMSLNKLKDELEVFKRMLNPISQDTDERVLQRVAETKDYNAKICQLNESVKSVVQTMEDMCDRALTNNFENYQVSQPQEKSEQKTAEKGPADEKAIARLREKIAKAERAIEEVEEAARKMPPNSAVVQNKERIVRLLREEIKGHEYLIKLW